MKAFLDTILKLNKVAMAIAGIALTFIVVLTTLDVVLRALGRPILGTYEVVAIFGGIIIGLAAPLTSWRRGHISVDMVTSKLPSKARNFTNIVTRCVAVGLCLVIGRGIIRIGTDFWAGGEVSNTLQMPLYPVAYGIAACFFTLALVLFCDILKIFGGTYEP
jgi:TRAP-type C4-dicarboxylate transport system permease small subunit